MNNHESKSLRINLDLALTVNSTVLLHAYIWHFNMNSHLLWSSLQQPNFLFISLSAALFPFVLLRACMQNSSERCSCTSQHDKSSEYMYMRHTKTSTHRDCEVPVWFSQVAITPWTQFSYEAREEVTEVGQTMRKRWRCTRVDADGEDICIVFINSESEAMPK